MKSFSMHSLLFFIPDDICNLVSSETVIVVLCILLGITLIVLYRRIKHGLPPSLLEGMTTDNANANANDNANANATSDADTGMDPEVVNIKKQTDVLQSMYDQLKQGVDDQTNRINGNSHTLLKTMSDTPSQTNTLTHANVNADDPSKTKIPNINMS
jgi:hypothetical protein